MKLEWMSGRSVRVNQRAENAVNVPPESDQLSWSSACRVIHQSVDGARTMADAEQVLAENPQVVVVATAMAGVAPILFAMIRLVLFWIGPDHARSSGKHC